VWSSIGGQAIGKVCSLRSSPTVHSASAKRPAEIIGIQLPNSPDLRQRFYKPAAGKILLAHRDIFI
jgi:hypothetical protein